MPQLDARAVPLAQALRQLFGEIDRSMLAAGAAKGDAQTCESARLIRLDTGFHERKHAGEIVMRAFLLIQIFDHRRIFACEGLELFFAAGVWDASSIENKPTAVAAFVFRNAL